MLHERLGRVDGFDQDEAESKRDDSGLLLRPDLIDGFSEKKEPTVRATRSPGLAEEGNEQSLLSFSRHSPREL
jgi:hypothetical protein